MFSAPDKPFPRSLGWRISAWYALGFIASFILIGLFASWVTTEAGQHADRDEILGEFHQDATRCRQVGSAAFCGEVERKQPDIDSTLLRLSDAGGRTLLLVPAFGENMREVRRAEQELQRGRVRGWRQMSGGGGDGQEVWQVYGEPMPDGAWLQVAKSNRRGRETRQRLHVALAPVALFVVLVALAGAAMLTARALRPIHQLIATTRAVIHGGDMTARVPARTARGDELDELKALFNQMLARNEGLICGMREALDNVAHDLRTPLTRLRSSAEAALRDQTASAAKRGEALADALEESERLLAMMRVLMDISEAEHGTMRLHVEPLALAAVVATAVDLYEQVAEGRAVRVRVEVSSDLRVTADRFRLQQVVANLLDNALKYSPAGSEVVVDAGGESGLPQKVWLRVRDRGTGISGHDLPRIWDRLYRGDRSRAERGSGLGLSLVRAVVEAHGGRVEVASAPNAGSDFTVWLRADGAAQTQAP